MYSINPLTSAQNFVVSGSAINVATTVRESFTKSLVRLTHMNRLQIKANNHIGNRATSDSVVPLKAAVRESFTKSFV